MNILIDIGHPGHIHLLKNFYQIMKQKNYKVIVTIKDIDIQKLLLKKFDMEFITIGNKKDSLLAKAFSQVFYNFKIFQLVKKHNIDIGIGTSITIAHVSKITKMKSILLDDDDDDIQPLFVKYAHPFCDTVLTPSALKGKRASIRSVFYDSYHELAYLHPKYFTPDKSVLKEVGLTEKEIFFILRFNAFKAHHDIGMKGLNFSQKIKLIKLLEQYGKVFITTEKEIESEFEKYKLNITPEKIHSLMYYATMFLGDSQTMTNEASIIGTPALKYNSFAGKLAIPNELEKKYELCYAYNINEFENYFNKIKELLKNKNLKFIWKEKRKKLLKDKINTTDFLVWFVENYPESVEIMRNNPDYQYRFK